MLFHAFRVVYTVKELDSHAKHGQGFKKQFGCITVFLCQKSYYRVRTSFGVFFSIVALDDVNEGGTPYMGISPRRAHPCTHRPEREQARAPASLGSTAGDSLRKNVSKEVCFWLWGKDNLVQLPKQPSVTLTADAVCFLGAATEFLKCVCWGTFYKQGLVRRWICISFDTERWSGPSYKRSRSWFRTADGKWNGIKCLCFVGDWHSSARHSLAPPTARLQKLGFFRRES